VRITGKTKREVFDRSILKKNQTHYAEVFNLAPFPASGIFEMLGVDDPSEAGVTAAPPDVEFLRMLSRPPVVWLILSTAFMVREKVFIKFAPDEGISLPHSLLIHQ